jgi:hypothetical protein
MDAYVNNQTVILPLEMTCRSHNLAEFLSKKTISMRNQGVVHIAVICFLEGKLAFFGDRNTYIIKHSLDAYGS